MALHPQVIDLIHRAKEAGIRSTHELSPQEARDQMEQMSKVRDVDITAVGTVENRMIPSSAGDIPVRIYSPPSKSNEKLPALMFFHGGGHVIGSLDTHDLVARNLCVGGECLVISVDYRMGPEHPFPAAPEDCFAATQWVATNADSLGGDSNRIAVSGDSAGGNLAAVVALMARDANGPNLCFQLLIYPVADYAFDTPSYSEWAEGAGILTAAGMEWFRDHYLSRPEDRLDWRAAPLRAESLADLPPALVITAECDVLHDEGVLYVEALALAGVVVEHRDYPGMIHGFFSFAPVIGEGAAAQVFAAKRLRSVFHA